MKNPLLSFSSLQNRCMLIAVWGKKEEKKKVY